MKKGFTLIELTISIALLGTITMAVFAIYMTAGKNFRVQSQRSYLQKEMNFTADALANEMKLATTVQQESQGKTLSGTDLIMLLPAVDNSGNFIYNGGIPEYDTFIYSREGNILRKIVIPSAGSSRSAKDFTVLTDVSSVSFTYVPDSINPLSITARLEVSRTVSKNNIKITAERTAFLRNKQ